MPLRPFALVLAAVAAVGCSSSAGDPSGGSGAPGGHDGKDVLQQNDWLNDKGEVTPPAGAAAPSSTVQHAICDYVFGGVGEVARAARLPGSVTLGPGSGYLTAKTGASFQCAYVASGNPAFIIELSGQVANLSSGKGLVTVDISDRVHGALAYAAEYTGPTIATSAARKWLSAAGDRVTK